MNEAKSNAPDIPLIDVGIRIHKHSRLNNITLVEIHVIVKRTLLDPISKRPITATVWGNHFTHVFNRQDPDIEEEIIHTVDTDIFLLAYKQYEAIQTMKAAIQLDKEGKLAESFSEYVLE